MINKNILENSLQLLEEVSTTLESWKTKPVVTFEEQKALADQLSQLLANTWSIDSVSAKIEAAEAKAAEELERINEYKTSIRAALADLREELSKDSDNQSPEPFNEEPEDKIEIEEDSPVESIPDYAPKTIAILEDTTTTVSIVDRFSIYDEDEPALATPISHLADAIGIIDKFLFVKELFNGNEDEFKNTVERLDNMSNLAEAQNYMATISHSVDKNSHAAKQFANLLVRRYMNM